MKLKIALFFLVFALFSSPLFGADFNNKFFIESQKFSSDSPSWQTTIGAKFGIFEHGNFLLAFNGRIETASNKIDVFGGAGLTDIYYRLEPRIYFKDYYLSINHWSLHKADTFGKVPNLNLITLGAEKSLGKLDINFGVQYKMTNSDADYDNIFFADAVYLLWSGHKKSVYARETLEFLPDIVSRTEIGLKLAVGGKRLPNDIDVFAGWQYGGPVSAQYGLSAEGFFGGFRINF